MGRAPVEGGTASSHFLALLPRQSPGSPMTSANGWLSFSLRGLAGVAWVCGSHGPAQSAVNSCW